MNDSAKSRAAKPADPVTEQPVSSVLAVDPPAEDPPPDPTLPAEVPEVELVEETTRFRFVGLHIDDLADGRILEPGLFYTLSAAEVADPHNADRIEARSLVEVPAAKTKDGD